MKSLKYATLLLMLISLVACADTEGETSIDDYFLNYEINEVPPVVDLQVGAFLYTSALNNTDYWERITQERDEANGLLGPYVKPELGQYSLNTTYEGQASFQQIVDWGVDAGIDFFVLSTINENRNQHYPRNISTTDSLYMSMINNKIDTLPIDLKGIKYAVMINMESFCSDLSNNNLLETRPFTNHNNLLVSREELLYLYYERISDEFNNDNYYKTTDGKPVVVIRGPEKLYTDRSKEVYDSIRTRIRNHTMEKFGKSYDVYLVAQQRSWTPPARWHYFHLSGGVDAITVRNLADVGGGWWERTYMLPQAMNENLKYNREYVKSTYNIDFIPPVSTSHNQSVITPTAYNYPQVEKTSDSFAKFCNVAKMNMGKNSIVLIDAFNNWSTNSAIEPTVEGYGNGYGKTYLNIVKQQFKH